MSTNRCNCVKHWSVRACAHNCTTVTHETRLSCVDCFRLSFFFASLNSFGPFRIVAAERQITDPRFDRIRVRRNDDARALLIFIAISQHQCHAIIIAHSWSIRKHNEEAQKHPSANRRSVLERMCECKYIKPTECFVCHNYPEFRMT